MVKYGNYVAIWYDNHVHAMLQLMMMMMMMVMMMMTTMIMMVVLLAG